MCKKICITNRHLVSGDFQKKIAKILSLPQKMSGEGSSSGASGPSGVSGGSGASSPSGLSGVSGIRPDALILREKDLTGEEYLRLALQVRQLCEAAGVRFIAHSFARECLRAGILDIHLPLAAFVSLTREEKKKFELIGVSAHSPADIRTAQEGGASYVTFSPIFPTQCKPGAVPKGLPALREACEHSSIPVFALGGVHPENIAQCMENGAAGVCMMSEYMR